jgi:uncharacterized protein
MIHNQLVIPLVQQSQALCGQLDKAAAWCAENDVSESDLLDTRLAPDMFPLSQQLNFVVAQIIQPLRRLTAAEWADPAEAGPTLSEHKARIEAALAICNGIAAETLDASATNNIALDLPNGMAFDLSGSDYVRDWAIPQFYFHLMAAYSILRMRGVPLGKADFVPHMMRHIRRQPS